MPISFNDLLERLPGWAPAAGISVLFLLGLLTGAGAARRRASRRIARQRAKGRAGERAAVRLLRRAGYRILDTEVTAHGRILVDGKELEFRIRADALVTRWWRRYVAEFKGGRDSASPGNRHTRRQLMEYAHVFRVRGVLLVDAPAGKIHRVEFPTG